MKKRDKSFDYIVKEEILQDLGARQSGEDICFSVAVPDRKACSLLLYEKGEKEAAVALPMAETAFAGDVRGLRIEKLPPEQYEYNYLIGEQIVTDPYARGLTGRETWGVPAEEAGLRGRLSFAEYNWKEDKPLRLPYEDIVMYGTHVRGFTMSASSRVRSKGTFRGVAEKIPYLKSLGVNLLELMPIYEFAEVPGHANQKEALHEPFSRRGEHVNYWGYGPGFFFAPKASYSSTGDPERELKDLVQALHKNGIELVLEFYFPKGTRPGLVLDCIRYWVSEYHLDGVRVNRDFAPVEALAADPYLSGTKILCESFRLEEIYEERRLPLYRNLAECNDGFMLDARRFLKGDEGQLEPFAWRVRRNPGQYAVINYMATHNGFTLADLVSYDEKHNEANGENNRDGSDFNYSWNCGEEGVSRKRRIVKLRGRQARNAFTMLLLSQGTPYLYGGDELGNSQEGNNNVYCQDNELSWINWNTGIEAKKLQSFVKKLIAFRKEHLVFHQKRELRATDYLSCGYPDISYHGKQAWYGDFENYSRSVGVFYAGDYIRANSGGEETDSSFYVAYNMHWIPHEFALPALPGGEQWYIAVDTGDADSDCIYPEGQEKILEDQRTVTVPERTILVLIGR